MTQLTLFACIRIVDLHAFASRSHFPFPWDDLRSPLPYLLFCCLFLFLLDLSFHTLCHCYGFLSFLPFRFAFLFLFFYHLFLYTSVLVYCTGVHRLASTTISHFIGHLSKSKLRSLLPLPGMLVNEVLSYVVPHPGIGSECVAVHEDTLLQLASAT